MSERVISDPTVAGWELNPDTGYWMWAASGGSGGSIQDGDTEGQITTWDGTEWTPEGAVVVSGGNVGIGTDSPDSKLSVVGETNTPISIEATGASSSASTNYKTPSGEWFTGVDVGGTDGSYSIWSNAKPGRVMTIGASGNVGIGSAPLVLSGTRTYVDGQGAGGGIEIHSGGTRQAQMYSAADGTVNIGSLTDQPLNIIAGGGTRITVDKNGRVDIAGSLFINGQEVTTGGGGGGFWVEETPGVIKYNGTAKATDLVAG